VPPEVLIEGCPTEVVAIMCACWGEAVNRPSFEVVADGLNAAISKMAIAEREHELIRMIAPQLMKSRCSVQTGKRFDKK
jgi:hypothetical protein